MTEAEQERAAVVAYLQKLSLDYGDGRGLVIHYAAKDILRGHHLTK